jgi:hypothetical protein
VVLIWLNLNSDLIPPVATEKEVDDRITAIAFQLSARARVPAPFVLQGWEKRGFSRT